MPPRLLAIGDIHGCSRALATLIGAIKPGSDDTVVTLGDYVDRGPDTRGVLEQLLVLRERCRLVPIMGNHEEMLVESLSIHSDMEPTSDHRGWREHRIRLWLEYGGDATLASYAGGEIPGDHFAFLDSCLDYFESDKHIFVHASFAPGLPMSEQSASMLRWESLREAIPGPHQSGKTVIVGHTSQKSGEILDLGYLKCIDTYCYGGGWLTALDVLSGEVWQANERGKVRG
jgi:serine/threonine protein phosphatase 1